MFSEHYILQLKDMQYMSYILYIGRMPACQSIFPAAGVEAKDFAVVVDAPATVIIPRSCGQITRKHRGWGRLITELSRRESDTRKRRVVSQQFVHPTHAQCSTDCH